MSDANQTPPGDPKTAGEWDAYLALQGLIVIVLGALAIVFAFKGEVDRAAELGVGLVGALQLQRRQRNPQP